MPDQFTPNERSEIMRRVKSKDTSLEKKVRSVLHKRGLRYRLYYDLPGKPDIVFVRARVVIFIDSCFWHGCPQHCRMPNSNQEYWEKKIQKKYCS
jgi:DNA mismatch endonuclease, patch repair protein